MTAPTVAPARPAARPVTDALWEARVVDAGVIPNQLNRLWAKVSGVSPAAPSPSSDALSAAVLTRASTLNLTAVGRSRADAQRIEQAVTNLGDVYPSRATILVADPERPPDADDGLDVRLELLEQPAARGRGAVQFERVTVEGSAANERKLASIASPLLVVDLPDFLWWATDSIVDSPLFGDLIDVSDRAIVDSAAAPRPDLELSALLAVLERGEPCPRLSDFAWARLQRWRGLLAQFFDTPQTRPALDLVDEVVVGYGANPRDPRSGFTAALLLVGWLAARLNWTVPGPLVPNRDESGGWHATFRATVGGVPREVVVTLHPSPRRDVGPALAEVTLLAGGGTTGRFRAERIDGTELMTTSQLDGLPRASRMTIAPLESEAELLADELRRFGRDQVFEAALRIATALVPASQRTGAPA